MARARSQHRSVPLTPLEWPRADPAALAAFDPASKVCTMNCGPHRDDRRSDRERLFLCDECLPVTRIWHHESRLRTPACEGLSLTHDEATPRSKGAA